MCSALVEKAPVLPPHASKSGPTWKPEDPAIASGSGRPSPDNRASNFERPLATEAAVRAAPRGQSASRKLGLSSFPIGAPESRRTASRLGSIKFRAQMRSSGSVRAACTD